MARKIQFDIADEAGPTRVEHVEPPSRAPALSGMARSLQAAAAAAIREVETRLIDESQFKDRIDPEEADILELAESIRAQGQLIPILLSPTPGGRYRIVYGRRRLAALRHLGLPAKALVRELDEDQAIIAQGQENTYRKDLTWIEKAAFAKQLLDAGKSDQLICDALNIDQKARKDGDKLTGLSRMRQVTARLAPEVIEAIGPAPKIGRDRWYQLAQLVEKSGFPPGNQSEVLAIALSDDARGMASDDRFLLLESRIRQPRPVPLSGRNSARGAIKVSPRSVSITITSKADAPLHRWIAENPDAALQALRDGLTRNTHS